ncbi:adhesion G protein-coupled receptor F5-like [Lissotriton helveticus]
MSLSSFFLESAAKINMQLTISETFTADLNDQSSEKYIRYKRIFEEEFYKRYRTLPGFVSANVTSFREGSVHVNYVIIAEEPTKSSLEVANANIVRNLNTTFPFPSSPPPLVHVVSGQTNFTSSPDILYQGDTLVLTCRTRSNSTSGSWTHNGNPVTISAANTIKDGVSESVLVISNITSSNSGEYSCSLDDTSVIYVASRTVNISSIYTTFNSSNDFLCDGNLYALYTWCTNGQILDLDCDCLYLGGPKIHGNIQTVAPDNCKRYLLRADISYCRIETSGETSSHRCYCRRTRELISDILTVTLIRKAKVEVRGVTNVSQRDNLTLVCSSDVPIYESMTWQVVRRDGGSPDLQAYLLNKNATLYMPNVLQYWEGNYTCTVFQRITSSSINSVITILPLPSASQLRTNIVDGIYACPSIVNLTCCATDSNKYNFQFKVQGSSKPINEFSSETQCFETTYNYTSCDMDRTVIDCIVNNTLKSTTKSMIVRPLKGKATCNGFGIGQEGDTIIIPCSVDFAGTITYTCNSSVWGNPTNSCIPQKLSQLVAESKELRFLPPSEIPIYLENFVSNVTAAEENINTFATMNALVGVLKTVSEVTTSVDVTMMQNFLNTTDVLVKKQGTWASVTQMQRIEGGSQLLRSMETFSQGIQINDTVTQLSNTIIFHGIVANNATNDYYEDFAFGNTTGKVNISSETLATIRNFRLLTIAYSSLNDILTVNQSETVNGLVMSMVVSKQKGANLRDNFNISMMFEKINSSLSNASCVFWKFNDYGSGEWDTTGCTTIEQEDQVLCTCDHLTPFTILMSSPRSSPSGGNTMEEEKQRQVTLEYITYIGVTISMGSLVICLIIETLSWKSVTKNKTSYMRHVCLVNIAVSLLIADIWFIVGASLTPHLSNHTISNATTKHTQACDAATFFTHTFYLAVFFWMLAMGLILFYRLVYVLHYMTNTFMLALAFSLGYGCPLIIAVVTVAVTSPQNYYREGNSCWLNMLNTRAFLAFVIPALTIVAVNFIILALVIITLLRPSVGAQPRKEEKNTLLKIAKSVAILTPLLGLTWGFGIGILITNNFVLNVIFSLLNSLQGFFILVFGSLVDTKTREALVSLSRSASLISKGKLTNTVPTVLVLSKTPVIKKSARDSLVNVPPVFFIRVANLPCTAIKSSILDSD